MNKALTFIMIFTGTVFSVFLLNIVMYALVPGYHDALSSVIRPDNAIPVVEVDRAAAAESETRLRELTAGKETAARLEYLVDEEVALSETAEDTVKAASESNTATALQIISKEYHEDCGTGEGYWVITYSDGSVGIE